MASPQQVAWLKVMYTFAKMAAHAYQPWPLKISKEDYARAAACEAANETGWGAHTPPQSNNVLGITASKAYKGPSVSAMGSEGATTDTLVASPHKWRVYASPEACFTDQLHILTTQKETDGSLTYQKALDATNVMDYILAECREWSRLDAKGQDVLITLGAHKGDLA
jgi:hypothetical protein